jgi:hypothetical protein
VRWQATKQATKLFKLFKLFKPRSSNPPSLIKAAPCGRPALRRMQPQALARGVRRAGPRAARGAKQRAVAAAVATKP